ncbi:MAG: WG repeat-containing protein [Bacteroidales bacterium]|nr:WG repeat-containing protein [Bacteroidales bacterium]
MNETDLMKTKVLVKYADYKKLEDKRLRIPFDKNGFGKWGLMDRNGHVILEDEYDWISDDCYEENDMILVCKEYPAVYPKERLYIHRKFGVVDINGRPVLDVQYRSITICYDEKVFVVELREKGIGIIDFYGNEVVPIGKYNWVDDFYHGLARVIHGDKWGIIDYKGNIVVPFVYENIWTLNDHRYPSVRVEKDGITFHIPIQYPPMMNYRNKKL